MHSLFTDASARNLAFFGSIALSLWAVFADPVVDAAGARLIIAAEHSPSWPQALPLGEAGSLPLMVAQLGALLDIDMENAARVCNGLFFVWLCLAFVALVQRLGADGPTACLAAVLVLALPELNVLRPHLASQLPFAALCLSALSLIFSYRLDRGRLSLILAVSLVFAAASLRIEALALLVPLIDAVMPDYRPGVRLGYRLAIVAGLTTLLCARVVIDALDLAGLSWQAFAAAPADAIVDGWARARDEFAAVSAAVRDRLLGEFAGGFAVAVTIVGLATAALSAVVATLGVFSLPAVHGLTMRGGIDADLRGPWAFALIWFWLVVAVAAIGRSSVSPANTLIPALIALSAAPLSLRAVVAAGSHARPLMRAVAVMLLAACVVTGVAGLDLRRDDAYLKEAGSWLRAHIAGDAPIFFGHSAVALYAGRRETLALADRDAWRETSALFWSGRQRDYRAIVAHIDAGHAYREANLLRLASIEPFKRFTGDNGSIVVFRIPPGS